MNVKLDSIDSQQSSLVIYIIKNIKTPKNDQKIIQLCFISISGLFGLLWQKKGKPVSNVITPGSISTCII